MGDSSSAVAKQFPDTKFAIIDVNAAGLKGEPKNVRGIVFAEQEAGCLAGVAAATTSKSGTISSVGGLKIPPVDAYIAGYQYCAKKVKPGIKTLNGYSQDFVDQAKCKEIALNQIGEGSTSSSRSPAGAASAPSRRRRTTSDWGIGVDKDQCFLGPQVLTSAQKKVDVGVYDTIKLAGGTASTRAASTASSTSKNGGVGYGKVSVEGAEARCADRQAERVDEAARVRQGQAAAHRQVAHTRHM